MERLRFVSKDIAENLTGVERLRIDFQKKNTLEAVVRKVRYLLAGSGDSIERAHDCVYGNYKLGECGEACVMALLDWGDAKRPPFNNRSIRGIRFLGFDVEHLLAGEGRNSMAAGCASLTFIPGAANDRFPTFRAVGPRCSGGPLLARAVKPAVRCHVQPATSLPSWSRRRQQGVAGAVGPK